MVGPSYLELYETLCPSTIVFEPWWLERNSEFVREHLCGLHELLEAQEAKIAAAVEAMKHLSPKQKTKELERARKGFAKNLLGISESLLDIAIENSPIPPSELEDEEARIEDLGGVMASAEKVEQEILKTPPHDKHDPEDAIYLASLSVVDRNKPAIVPAIMALWAAGYAIRCGALPEKGAINILGGYLEISAEVIRPVEAKMLDIRKAHFDRRAHHDERRAAMGKDLSSEESEKMSASEEAMAEKVNDAGHGYIDLRDALTEPVMYVASMLSQQNDVVRDWCDDAAILTDGMAWWGGMDKYADMLFSLTSLTFDPDRFPGARYMIMRTRAETQLTWADMDKSRRSSPDAALQPLSENEAGLLRVLVGCDVRLMSTCAPHDASQKQLIDWIDDNMTRLANDNLKAAFGFACETISSSMGKAHDKKDATYSEIGAYFSEITNPQGYAQGLRRIGLHMQRAGNAMTRLNEIRREKAKSIKNSTALASSLAKKTVPTAVCFLPRSKASSALPPLTLTV